jgi:hypothetical protein
MSSTAISLGGLMSAISEIFNIFVQYLPLIFTVGIIFAITNYAFGGFGGILGNITGMLSGA